MKNKIFGLSIIMLSLGFSQAGVEKFTFLEGVVAGEKSQFCANYKCSLKYKLDDAYGYTLSKLPSATLYVNRGLKDIASMSLEEMETMNWDSEDLGGYSLLFTKSTLNSIDKRALGIFLDSFLGKNSITVDRIISKCNKQEALDQRSSRPVKLSVRGYSVMCIHESSKKFVGIYIN